MTDKQLLRDAIQRDDLDSFRSVWNTDIDALLDDAYFYGLWHNENILQFVCATHHDRILEKIIVDPGNFNRSLFAEFAMSAGSISRIASLLDELSPHLPQYMEHYPAKKEMFKYVLDACVIVVCGRRYPHYESVEEFDAVSITAIEALKRCGAAPTENMYESVLQPLAERSTTFIRFMSSHINYHACLSQGRTLFQLLLQSLWASYRHTDDCASLQYLIDVQRFDPSQCHYEHSRNVLHHVRRADLLAIVLPILHDRGCLRAYLSQRDKDGKTPIDVHLHSPDVIAAFVRYEPSIECETRRKTRKRGGAIEAGCKLYFSAIHANQNDLFYYRAAVLKFVSPSGASVLCTWKSFPDEDGSEYPFTDKQLVGELAEGWQCAGTQCVGSTPSGRCAAIIPLGKESKNSCTVCWNRMRDFFG